MIRQKKLDRLISVIEDMEALNDQGRKTNLKMVQTVN